ncbi:type VII secretion target [Nocardia sp. NBC_01009]|uniref:type VII secretion target n=1 Tax=unclassified Nocardia TaxID=2637762 RepID=UPI00386C646A|nr:type VII secretion target [Nocardia sp. NBC_01009]
MWNSDDVVVNPDRVRAHAGQVESTLENVSKAKEAADYLAKVDDGYGSLVGWLAGLMVDSLHDRITSSLKQIVETTETLPKTLRHCADVFDNLEASRKAEIERQQSQIN